MSKNLPDAPGSSNRPLRYLAALSLAALTLIAGNAAAWYPQNSTTPLPTGIKVEKWQIIGPAPGMPFNGINQYLDLGNDAQVRVSANDFSVSAAVYFDSLTTLNTNCTGSRCNEMSIIDKMYSTPKVNSDGWRLYKGTDNRFYFCLGAITDGCSSTATSTQVSSSTVAETKKWYHIVVRKGNGLLSIVVNGEPQSTIQIGPYTDTNIAKLFVARDARGKAYLAGRVRTIGLFPAALSPAQIRTLWRNAHIAPLKQSTGSGGTTDDNGLGDGTTNEALPDTNITTATTTNADVLAGATPMSSVVALPDPSAPLKISNARDRSDARELDGAFVGERSYIFAAVDQGIREVRFWLDDPTPSNPSGIPVKTERRAPFDLLGTAPDGGAIALDTGDLAPGRHTVTVEIVTRGAGSAAPVSSTFTVLRPAR